ncbi:MAG: hypothetical protein ACOCUR_00980, partial [Nanoarchaeota archaeon]
MFYNKRAQITVFIIVGLIILIGAATFFILRDTAVREQFEEGSQKIAVESVSSDFRPVQEYITTCVRDVAREGLVRIGRHGGYAYTDELVANRLDPTSREANSVFYLPGHEDYKVAYWWHMDSGDDCFATSSCTFSSKRLPLRGSNSVESHLEEYVEKEVIRCMDEFRSLSQMGFDVDIVTDPSAEVDIADSNVFVNLKMPVSATKDTRNQDLTFYTTVLDVDFASIYNMAEEITEFQESNAFLETQLIELIALYSGTSRTSLLPPFYDPFVSRLGGDVRQAWTRTEVKSTLMSVLASYVPLISFSESKTINLPSLNEDPYDAAVFSSMLFSLNNSELELLYDIELDYKNWWDMYVKIGSSEIIEPGDQDIPVLGDIPILGSAMRQALPYTYQFGYDVSYPVMVTLRDSTAFDGDGFVLKFALESNIRNNMPVSSSPDAGGFDMSSSLYDSIFCSEENYNSGEVTVRARDSSTGELLEGANVD